MNNLRHDLERETECLKLAIAVLTRLDLFPRHAYDSYNKEQALTGLQGMVETRKKMIESLWAENRLAEAVEEAKE